LVKPNYKFEKRQRDIAKKKKQEEKRLRRLGKTDAGEEQDPGQTAATEVTG